MKCDNLTPYTGDLPYDTSLSNIEKKEACKTFKKWQIDELSTFLVNNTEMMCLAGQVGAMINYKGEVVSGNSYNSGDVVSVSGDFYISNSDNNNTTPPSEKWVKFVNYTSDTVNIRWFGAKVDANFAQKTGNNDKQALEDALATGKEVVIDGYIYVEGQVTLTDGMRIRGIGKHKSGIRNKFSPTESAIVILGSNCSVKDIEVQAHCTGARGENEGHLGNCVRTGEFFTTGEQSELKNIEIDILATRTPSETGDYSDPAPAICFMSNTSSSKAVLEIDGGATKHTIGFQAHWGGYNTNADATKEPIETYHPHALDIDIIRDIKNCDTGIVLSSVGNVTISDYTIIKPKRGLLILPGDNINKYADENAKDIVLKGLNIGRVTVLGTDNSSSTTESILISGRGTSKWDTYIESGVDTGILKQHQLPLDLTINGATLRATQGEALKKGLRATGVIGKMNLGAISAKGYTQSSIEEEYCFCESEYSVIDTDCPLKYEYSRGGTILGSDVRTGITSSDPSPIYVSGDNLSYTLDGNHTAGDTVIRLTNALTEKIHLGQQIKVGTTFCTATNTYTTGCKEIEITPLTDDVADGSDIIINRRAILPKLVLETKGGYNGAYFVGCDVNLYGTGTQNTGRIGIKGGADTNINIYSANVKGNGKTSVYNDYYVPAGCTLNHYSPYLDPAQTKCDKHYKVLNGGRVNIFGGVVLDTNILMDDSSGDNRHSYFGLVDANGVLINS